MPTLLAKNVYFTFGVLKTSRGGKEQARLLNFDFEHRSFKSIDKEVASKSFDFVDILRVTEHGHNYFTVDLSRSRKYRFAAQGPRDTELIRKMFKIATREIPFDEAEFNRAAIASGYVHKRNFKTGVVSQRFLIVTAGKVFVFSSSTTEDSKSRYPRNVISLEGVTKVALLDDGVSFNLKYGADRVESKIGFLAATSQERNLWVDLLRKALKASPLKSEEEKEKDAKEAANDSNNNSNVINSNNNNNSDVAKTDEVSERGGVGGIPSSVGGPASSVGDDAEDTTDGGDGVSSVAAPAAEPEGNLISFDDPSPAAAGGMVMIGSGLAMAGMPVAGAAAAPAQAPVAADPFAVAAPAAQAAPATQPAVPAAPAAASSNPFANDGDLLGDGPSRDDKHAAIMSQFAPPPIQPQSMMQQQQQQQPMMGMGSMGMQQQQYGMMGMQPQQQQQQYGMMGMQQQQPQQQYGMMGMQPQQQQQPFGMMGVPQQPNNNGAKVVQGITITPSPAASRATQQTSAGSIPAARAAGEDPFGDLLSGATTTTTTTTVPTATTTGNNSNNNPFADSNPFGDSNNNNNALGADLTFPMRTKAAERQSVHDQITAGFTPQANQQNQQQNGGTFDLLA